MKSPTYRRVSQDLRFLARSRPSILKQTCGEQTWALFDRTGLADPHYDVCVDTLHSSFGNLGQSRRALEKFFGQEHDTNAQYALMNLSRRLEALQDSTRDPSLILAALSSKKFQSSIVDGEAASIQSDSARLRGMLNGFSPLSCGGSGARVRGQIVDTCSDMKERVQRFIFKSAERTALLTRIFVQELKVIMGTLAEMPRRRTLILISDGFNLVPGRELYGIASVYFRERSRMARK